jgi:hypothetical protein
MLRYNTQEGNVEEIFGVEIASVVAQKLWAGPVNGRMVTLSGSVVRLASTM